MINYQDGTLAQAVAFGGAHDTVQDPDRRGTFRLSDVRDELSKMGYTAQSFATLHTAKQDEVTRRLFATLIATKKQPVSPMRAVPPPSSIEPINNAHAGANFMGTGQAGQYTVEDLYRLGENGGELRSEWVRSKMRDMGYDPDHYTKLGQMKRAKLARKMLKMLHAENDVNARRGEFTTEQVRAAQIREDMKPRVDAWARGPLTLEKPQGSSFHHLCDYARVHAGEFTTALDNGTLPTPQLFVVDHDWDKAFSKSEGFNEIVDWPLPYENCCFEFRITGVRVLAFVQETDIQDGGKYLHCVYGMDGHWQSDDIEYIITRGDNAGGWCNRVSGRRALTRQPSKLMELTAFVTAQVRAVCIMLDAQVATTERREASGVLNRKRGAQGKRPLLDHHVIRLSKRRRGERDRSSVPLNTGRHVRLHWRRGHWRHHDRVLDDPDPDIRIIESVNDGGFYVTKQWINSMLVGDESLGFVEKEYRL